MAGLRTASATRIALVGLVAVGLSSLGCNLGESTSSTCSPPPEGCPRSTFTTAMTGGSITYRVRSAAPSTNETLVVSDGDATKPGCSVIGLDGEILSDETVNTLGPGIHCTLPGGYLYASLEGLSDVRSLPAGTHSFRGSQGMVVELCDQSGGGGLGCTMCRPTLDDVTITVVVEEAAGGPAPYPTMVTPDYRRRYRIAVDTGPRSTGGCDGLDVSLELGLEQTAAQFVNNPHGECMPCE